MFAGHALLAFALAALAADWRGWDRNRALAVGVAAGAFAAIPDVDVAYALVGLAEWVLADAAVGAPSAFWEAGNVVHRSVTHSLVVGIVAAPAFGLLAVRASSSSSASTGGPDGSRRSTLATVIATGLFGTLVAMALLWDGLLAALVVGLFLASGAVVARGFAIATTLSPATISMAALWGLWSHPWGDLFTGDPPDWAFPFSNPAFESMIVLHPDPTLHLLGAFAIELGTVWLAAVAVCRLTERSILRAIDRRATVGAFYGVVALVATPPTLEVSYHFVFSILAVGLVCTGVHGAPRALRRRPITDGGRPSPDAVLAAAVTAVAGVTAAFVTYVVVYVVAVAA